MSPIVGQPDTIEGHQYIINNDMAGSGTANNKSVLFGKFDKYFIRQVKGLSLVRFDEKYMNAAQIGWTAFGRWDGRVIDAGTKPIMYGDHAAT
jgi:HK97 family phage major capsid protein